jgi:hypothetical protein
LNGKDKGNVITVTRNETAVMIEVERKGGVVRKEAR